MGVRIIEPAPSAGRVRIIEPATAPKSKPKRTGYDEVTGGLANLYRSVPLMDEAQGAFNAVGDVLTGKSKVNLLAYAGAPIVGRLAGPQAGIDLFKASGAPEAFKKGMEKNRAYEDDFAERRPMVAAGIRGGGNAASVFIPAAKVMQSGNLLGNVARGAITASGNAAAYAATDRGTAQERLGAASEASYNPVVLGLGAAGGALATPRAGKQKPAAPSLDDLKAQKNAAYGAVEASGVRYATNEVDDLVARIEKDVAGKNISPSRHPKAYSMLEDVKALRGKELSLTEMDQLRQVIRRDVANSSDPAEQFFGKRMIAELDSFVDVPATKAVAARAEGVLTTSRIADDYDQHHFEYTAPNGERVTGFVTPPKARGGPLEIDINGAGSESGGTQGAGRIGVGAVRDLAAQLQAAYPEASSITGLRTTGARPAPALATAKVRPVENSRAHGGDILRHARDLNTRVRKVESVNDAVESAQRRAGSTGSGGNVDNAIRQNLRRVLEDTGNLSPAERAALEDIVMGSKGQNVLRQLGKLSPQGNGLMTALSIGGAAANPLLAIPTMVGAVSKTAADGITRGKVQNLVQLMAQGGRPALDAEQELAKLAASDPAVAAIYRQVAERLSRVAGAAGSVPAQSAPRNALRASN